MCIRDSLSGDQLRINFIDDKADEFRSALITASEKEGKTAIQTYLKKYELPRSLLQLILKSIPIEPETRLAEITKIQRNQLVAAFCEYPFVVEKVGGFNMAMATAGAVSYTHLDVYKRQY